MKHGHLLEGVGFRLRPIADHDAEFVVDLRTSSDRSRYLNKMSSSVATQIKWLEEYYQRENDYYFVIERATDGMREGLIALYDVSLPLGEAEWGRWITSPSSLGAIESVVMVMDFAFNNLSLKRVYSYTVADNAPVNSFHESCGFRRVQAQAARFTMGGNAYDAIRHECNFLGWATIRKTLVARSDRIARLISSYDPRR